MLTLCLDTHLAQSSAPASQKVSPSRTDEEGEAEEGEAMETLNDDDEAMLAMMGMTGFGSTKVILLKFLFSLLANLLAPSRVSTSRGTKKDRQTSRRHELGDST
jgi:hypothetical protein